MFGCGIRPERGEENKKLWRVPPQIATGRENNYRDRFLTVAALYGHTAFQSRDRPRTESLRHADSGSRSRASLIYGGRFVLIDHARLHQFERFHNPFHQIVRLGHGGACRIDGDGLRLEGRLEIVQIPGDIGL